MTYEDDLRVRRERGAPRGTTSVWAAATLASGGSGSRGRRRMALVAAAFVMVAGVGLLFALDADNPADAEIESASPITAPTATPTPSTVPDALPDCTIAVLNAIGRVGAAAEVSELIQDFRRDAFGEQTTIFLENATTFDGRTAVLHPPADVCVPPKLVGEATTFPEPTPSPWPADLASYVHEDVPTDAVVVILGEDWVLPQEREADLVGPESLDDMQLVSCEAESTPLVWFADDPDGMAPAPRAEMPEAAADEFVEWFNLLPLDTDPPTPFIAPRPTGWSKVVDVEGGWRSAGTRSGCR